MQSLASCPHLTQSLDPTHRSVIEPNTTQPPTFAKNTTQLDPTQSKLTHGCTQSRSSLTHNILLVKTHTQLSIPIKGH